MVVPAGRRESAETQTDCYSAETKPEDSSDMQRPCSGFAASDLDDSILTRTSETKHGKHNYD